MSEQNFLYILSRNDMKSLGAGCAIAQGVHIGNQFTAECIYIPEKCGEKVDERLIAWTQEARHFGTTIVLSASLNELASAVMAAQQNGFIANVVVDPEYHLHDGKTVHIIPNVVTGAYVFGNKEKLERFLGEMKLYPNTYLHND